MTVDQALSLIDAETLVDEHLDDVLHCFKCNQLVLTQAYSSIKDWEANHGISHEENIVETTNHPTSSQSERLTLLQEQIQDKLYCPICSLLIFPPTYSCPSCELFYHKSCAELPRKYTSERGHTFALLATPFRNGLCTCTHCKYCIKGYAYVCTTCETILDVQCALGAPLKKLMNHEHRLCTWRSMRRKLKCKACCNYIDKGTLYFGCYKMLCKFHLHVECALLPPIVFKYKIHQHSLELATDLADLDDEYICDACEKDLNPTLWAYRCMDNCKERATSHVTCVITSKKKCHFRYDDECDDVGNYEVSSSECDYAESGEDCSEDAAVEALKNLSVSL